MDHLAAPAKAATAHRAGVSFTSIGVEVEEPVFLDEADAPDVTVRDADRPSPFDLFADEETLAHPAPELPAAPASVATPAVRAAAVRPVTAPRGTWPATGTPDRVKRTVEAPELFKTHSTSTTGSISLVALFVLVAATTMVMTVQACQVSRAPQAAGLAQPGH
ncbi:MAG: hypothetical protein ABI211_11360 [Vicinamibacterales bacterium]